MKYRKLFTLGLCLMLGLSVFAQGTKKDNKKTDLSKEIKLESTVRYGKLANGMTYYIKANKMPENRAEFQIAVNAGSILEREDQLGLAHFTEHMGFNGTKQFPGNELTSELQKNGITFGRDDNAYTAFDETVYTLTLPTDKPELFNLGLKVLDGWASGMLMTDKQIDDERGVIIEEWRLGQGAEERMRRATWPIIFKGSRYAERLPIGTVENLKTFKYSSIRDYYKKWYRPDNQALIIVGDFDADEMEQKVKDYFSMNEKPSTPLERPLYDVPDNKEPLIAIATDKEASSNSIELIFKHPAWHMKTVGDFRNQELMVNLYEHMLSNRFSEKSQKKGCPYMYAISGYAPAYLARTMGGYIMRAGAKDGKIMDALKALLEENQRVIQHGFLQTELDRAKEAVLEQYERASKEANKTYNSTWAQRLVAHFLKGTPVPGARWEYRTVKALIDDITLDEINALAKDWITEENIVCEITMPERKGLKVPTVADVKKIIVNAKNMKTTPYVDTYKEVPFFAYEKEIKAGKVKSETKNTEFDYTEWTLSNGAKVILKPTTLKDDEILMQSWSNGGSSLYSDGDLFNVQMAAGIIDGSGIGEMNHNQLQKFQMKHSFGTEPYISDLREGIDGNCSPKDFELLLQYVYMYFTHPSKDKEVLDVRIENLRSQLKTILNNPETQFSVQLQKSMYPNDKRSISIPTEKQINSLNIDKMYKIFKERFSNASDFTFEFVGNFNIEEVKPMIEKYIGGLPSTGKTEMWKDVEPEFAKGKVDDKVYKGTEDKATIVLAMRKSFVNGDKERKVIDVMGEILQIRVTEKVREELGSVYSPYIGANYGLEPKPDFTMIAYYGCSPDNVSKVENATWEILDEMIQIGASEENLAKAKEQLIKRREASYTSSNSFWASVIKGSYIYGNKIANMEEYTNAVNAITVNDLKQAAAKYLTHDEFVKVTLLPETLKK